MFLERKQLYSLITKCTVRVLPFILSHAHVAVLPSALMALFLSSQDALKVMLVSQWVSESVSHTVEPSWLMWPWWVKIPTEDFTDETLVINDSFGGNVIERLWCWSWMLTRWPMRWHGDWKVDWYGNEYNLMMWVLDMEVVKVTKFLTNASGATWCPNF